LFCAREKQLRMFIALSIFFFSLYLCA